MDDNYPTAADYAQSRADDAHRRLERIEAALIKAGIMEEPPKPAPSTVDVRGMYESLRRHCERLLAEGVE